MADHDDRRQRLMSPAPPSTGTSPARTVRTDILAGLEAVRKRSLDLVASVPEGDLTRQISPIMSPLVWDLAHVGNYEDLWLVRQAGGLAGVRVDLDDLYDAFRHPRANRPALPLLDPDGARAYIAEVRRRVVDTAENADLDDSPDPLLRHGYVFGLVIQHEHQHAETMLATIGLRDAPAALAPAAPAPAAPAPAASALAAEVWVDGGPFVMGTDDEAWAYDNERPAHVVDLEGFWIDTAPVTNGEYMAFIDGGGYDRRDLWTKDGWAWRSTEGAEHPLFWHLRSGGGWYRRRFGIDEAIPTDHPVVHVCFHEAQAYARWAGKRLPTEAEWEKAASWSPDGVKRRYPWGHRAPVPGDGRANLDGHHLDTTPVGSHPRGASAYGCHQMVGDVWEWTSSEFATYPGFEAFPYREYSEVFAHSGYRVLRGGSWATSAQAVRTTFRNWDHPIRRQIFSGLRCARSEAGVSRTVRGAT